MKFLTVEKYKGRWYLTETLVQLRYRYKKLKDKYMN